MTAAMAPRDWEVTTTLAASDVFQQEIAYQRSRLRQVWSAHTARLAQADERLKAVELAHAEGSRALLDVLNDSPGSAEVEKAYLANYRRWLEELVRGTSSQSVAAGD